VVKELSENALDAGATPTEVEMADGGHERMLARDNGSGMSEEDSSTTTFRGWPRYPTRRMDLHRALMWIVTISLAFDNL
jgi:hypothetical protein